MKKESLNSKDDCFFFCFFLAKDRWLERKDRQEIRWQLIHLLNNLAIYANYSVLLDMFVLSSNLWMIPQSLLNLPAVLCTLKYFGLNRHF